MPTTISYGPDPLNLANIYDVSGNAPTVILVHGGGWSSGSRSDMAFTAQVIQSLGLRVAAIDYRLVPNVVWPAIMDDIRLACSVIPATFGSKHTKLFAWGYSAGGHMTAWLARERLIEKGVSISGPNDLGALTEASAVQHVHNLCPDGDYAAASPIYGVPASPAPMALWYGKNDPQIPTVQATLLANAWAAAGSSGRINIYSGGHSFDGMSSTQKKDAIKKIVNNFLKVA
jgi:dienelactone hydrolase